MSFRCTETGIPGIVAAVRALDTPTIILPLYMVIDCLFARGKDLRERPLYVRRNVIEDVLDEQELLFPVRRLSDDGLKAWQQVLEHGYEGLVAKDAASPYRGGRTLSWLKVKQSRYREGERGWEPQKS